MNMDNEWIYGDEDFTGKLTQTISVSSLISGRTMKVFDMGISLLGIFSLQNFSISVASGRRKIK